MLHSKVNIGLLRKKMVLVLCGLIIFYWYFCPLFPFLEFFSRILWKMNFPPSSNLIKIHGKFLVLTEK